MIASNALFFQEILSRSHAYFYIPVYQRNYSWSEDECNVLLSDIIKIYDGVYNDHFIGTIVYKPSEVDSSNLNVIDGQQRLTTFFLLCCAIMHTSDNPSIVDNMHDILFDKYNGRQRLTPIKSDNEVFVKVINNEIDLIKNHQSRIYQNYLFFKNKLTSLNLDSERLISAMLNLPSIRMELNAQDNPQIIFESINSTGLSLSIADLIRNYLLMGEEYSVQEEYFNKYWFKFEEKLGVENLVQFFEHYLNLKSLNTTILRNNMYNNFKNYYVKHNHSTLSLLQEVDNYIDEYQFLVKNDVLFSSDCKYHLEINKLRNDLLILNNQVAYMFLLNVLVMYKDKEINDDELLLSFKLTESYIFRRSICNLSTNSMQKIFRYLYSQIKSLQATGLSYKDALIHALITSKDDTNGRFPNNLEFVDSISTRNLYGKFRNLDYLLIKLETYNSKSIINFEDIEVTIEHVMPQTLTPDWIKTLGDDYKLLHEDFVHDIGNLTLTTINANLSNNSFNDKKEKLVEEAHFKLNQYILDQSEWNFETIKNRSLMLAQRASVIWEYPEINKEVATQIEENKFNKLSIFELHENYLSIKPTYIVINENAIQINSLRSGLIEVVNYLMNMDIAKFKANFVDIDRQIVGLTTFSSKQIDESYTNIKDIHARVNLSGRSIINNIIILLEFYDINPDDVIIKFYK